MRRPDPNIPPELEAFADAFAEMLLADYEHSLEEQKQPIDPESEPNA